MIVASVSGYDFISADIEGTDTLAQSIFDHGPHVVGVFANDNFMRYSSGIFEDDSCPTDECNHAVINVGYDTDAGYWIIRNSWGPSWGEDGHIRMAIGKKVCNIEQFAWVPKV